MLNKEIPEHDYVKLIFYTINHSLAHISHILAYLSTDNQHKNADEGTL